MSRSTRMVTAEELARLPEDHCRYELVKGRIIRMSPVGWRHGKVVASLLLALGRYIQQNRLGEIVTEVGFVLSSNPDTVRAPDLAFIRQDRLPPVDPRGFWHGAPDLAVEVLSPEDRATEVEEKVDEYLQHGVTVVLVVDPDVESVSVHRRLAPPLAVQGADAVLEIGDVLPGFSDTLANIFK